MGNLARFALIVGAAGLFAGCGGSQPPTGAPGAMPRSRTAAIATHAKHGGSWMLPEAKSRGLLYVSQDGGSYVSIYSYPQGEPEGVLDTPGWGLCSDAKRVFVTDYPISVIYEYAHGGIKTLRKLKDGDEEPFSCAVDPATGNLAVISGEAVAIFAGGKGSPKTFSESGIGLAADCYDDNGNLFVDGMNDSGEFALLELPKGGKTFIDITVNQYIGGPGPVQWDGRYLAIGYPQANLIYQFSIEKSRGKEVGYTYLRTKDGGVYSWLIEGGTVIGSSVAANNTYVWKYPRGGSPIKTLTGISGSSITLSTP
jgi:hypothetical protein